MEEVVEKRGVQVQLMKKEEERTLRALQREMNQRKERWQKMKKNQRKR